MAQNAPNCKDTQEVQFKLHDKFLAFKQCGELRSNVKLLAVSSSRGLLFAGNPAKPELKVIIIKDVASAKSTGQQPQARRISLPHIPNYMSCSSDGQLLAINYSQANGTSLLLIYAVQSFMTAEVNALYNIRLAPEDYVHAVQLLWNPVLPNSLAVVLSNGGLGMYSLKDGGNFELHSLDKSQQVKCGCWSPKGKQLVLGFPSGKLQQFKPDLTPAKTLNCPTNVLEAPFDTIAIHWLSTFQFAVIFLEHGEDCNPCLFIVNAPKAGAPTYTNYYDICYSLNGPRNHQFHFNHVPQWNLLLVTSANGVEVGVLGTTEAGDTPTWQQMTLLDEARIELPLSEANQDETFPMGFVVDTSTSHQLTINEQQLMPMPMVHVLGTDGTLLSFDFLNLQSGAVSICSPPPPLVDASGQFCALNVLVEAEQQQAQSGGTAAAPSASALSVAAAVVESSQPAVSDISFAFTPNTVTSTPAPAKDKPPSLFAGFGNVPAKPPASTFAATTQPLNFAIAPAPAAATAKPPTALGFAGFGAAPGGAAAVTGFGMPASTAASNFVKPMPTVSLAPAPTVAPLAAPVQSKPIVATPLYTVQPTFTPAAATAAPTPTGAGKASEDFNAGEVDDVIGEIMKLQITTFTEQIEQQKHQNRELFSQIESPNTIRSYAKRLDDLQELSDQAEDTDFELDVQGLRHGLTEAYAMIAECRAKLEYYRDPNITRLMTSTSFDAAGRRLLNRLQSYVAANEAQLSLAKHHIDTQWEQYQDVLRRNSKSKMHLPCMERIYERITRLQNSVAKQRNIHTAIKAKLKERGLLKAEMLNQENSRQRNNEAVDTLADSILSMTLNQSVELNRAKLPAQKQQSIRKLLEHRKIIIISPQRPDRVGLKSEVILESKRRVEANKKSAAAAAKPPTANKAVQAATATPITTAKSTTTTAAGPAPPTAAAATMAPPAGVTPSQLFGMKVQPVAAAAPLKATVPFSNAVPASATPPVVGTTPAMPGLFQNNVLNSNSMLQPKPAQVPSMDLTTKPAATPFAAGGNSPFSFGQLSSGNSKPLLPSTGLTMTMQPPVATTTVPSLFAGFGAMQPKPTIPTATAAAAAAAEVPKEQPKKEAALIPAATDPPATGGNIFAAAPKPESTGKAFSFAPSNNSSFSFGGFGASLGSNTTTTAGAATAAATVAGSPMSLGTTASAKSTTFSTPTFSFNSASSTPNLSSSSTTPTATSSTATPLATPTATPTATSSATPTATSTATSTTPASSPFSGNSSTPATVAVAPVKTESIDNLFGSAINICKPTTKKEENAPATGNIFGGFCAAPAAAAAATGIFAATTATKVDTTPGPLIATPAPTVATTPTATAAAATLSSPAATVASNAPTPAAAPTATAAAATTAATTPGSSFSFSNAFSSLGATPTAAATPSSSSIFGGSSSFGTTASPFQAAGSSGGNIFGSVPKPENSVFGGTAAVSAAATSPPSGLFAAAAATASPNASPFGAAAPTAATAATSGGNIFAQAALKTGGGFGSPAPTTAAAPVAAAPGGGSIFGGGNAAATPFGGGGGSIFGGSTQTTPAKGSVFGMGAFGGSSTAASGGNLFGGAGAAQPQASTGFGGGSIFGGSAASPVATGGSIFGGGSTTTGGFGSFAQTTPSAGGFGGGGGGGFAQTGGTSVAQTGFGSPQQQQAQSPTAGGFGAKPVFGGSPAFGASPTFGGAATFGSPMGLGAFGNAGAAVSPPAFGGVQAKPADGGNIFETLGGSDSGLSFGNLAQTGNANAQKSSFGGSSFMNYR